MTESPTVTIDTYMLGDFMTNCYVVTTPPAKECWIVDCGYQPEQMLDDIEQRGLKPVGLLLTHCHSDHMAGVDAALSQFGSIPVYVHEAEQGFCTNPMLNLSGMLGMPVTCTEPDHVVCDGDTLDLNGTTWRVVHAPGHSPGCIMYVHDASYQAIVGDTLMKGAMGRVDFPTSDPNAMIHTLAEVMMLLPDETVIHPGHGDSTTIGHERQTNPFVLQAIKAIQQHSA